MKLLGFTGPLGGGIRRQREPLRAPEMAPGSRPKTLSQKAPGRRAETAFSVPPGACPEGGAPLRG